MNFTYRYRRGPYVNATKGKEYISITFELSNAKRSSMQIRNNHIAISLFAVLKGFFVRTRISAKNDCDIPIYNMGSIFTIGIAEIYAQI
jgi:hypothetical protein